MLAFFRCRDLTLRILRVPSLLSQIDPTANEASLPALHSHIVPSSLMACELNRLVRVSRLAVASGAASGLSVHRSSHGDDEE